MKSTSEPLPSVQRINPDASPREVPDVPQPNASTNRIALRRDLRFVVIFDAIALMLATLVLDGGDFLRLAEAAILLSWVPILVITVRRLRTLGHKPSQVDSLIIRYGLLPCVLIMCVLYSRGMLPDRWYFKNRVHLKPPISAKP